MPTVIADDEHLLRTAFEPMHFSKGRIRPKCLKPMTKEPDEDDPSRMNNKVSVTRLDYAGWCFCLDHAHKNQKTNKVFKGFLKLVAGKVRTFGLDALYKPTDDNPFHANMVYQEINKPHEDELDELESANLQATMRKVFESGEYVSCEEAELLANQESQELMSNIHDITTVDGSQQKEIDSLLTRVLNLIKHWLSFVINLFSIIIKKIKLRICRK